MQIPREMVGQMLGGRREGPNEPVGEDEANSSPALARYLAAVEAARLGRYDEAEQLLASLGQVPRKLAARAYDLRAKICAQQGNHREAERSWSEALRLDPANTAYLEGLQALREHARPWRVLWLGVVGLVVAGVIVSVWMALAGSLARISGTQEDLVLRVARLQEQAGSRAESQVERIRGLEVRLAELKQTLDKSSAVLPHRLETIAADLQKAVATESANREKTMGEFEKQITAMKADLLTLNATLNTAIAAVSTQEAEHDKARGQQLKDLLAAVATQAKALASLEGQALREIQQQRGLMESINGGIEARAKKVDAADKRVAEDLAKHGLLIERLGTSLDTIPNQLSRFEARAKAVYAAQIKLLNALDHRIVAWEQRVSRAARRPSSRPAETP